MIKQHITFAALQELEFMCYTFNSAVLARLDKSVSRFQIVVAIFIKAGGRVGKENMSSLFEAFRVYRNMYI